MKNTLNHLTRILALAVALLTALPAHAALQDHGPSDPVLVWPQWYRDLNGKALGLCRSTAVDAVQGGPFCFPIDPNPAGFPGNQGDEIFYSNLGVAIDGNNGFSLRYEAALEAAYIPGPNPTHGQEVVFSRLRFLMNVPVTGTYTVIHPYGIQVFPDVQATGARAVFFTIDLPPGIPGDFAGALSGNMGPFPQAATVDPVTGARTPIEYTLVDAANTSIVHKFVGDAATALPYVGSPFGDAANFVRVIGPVGSNISGDPLNPDSIEEHNGVVLGQVWTAGIPTPFTIHKAVYHRTVSLAGTINSIDVWAQSAAGQNLVVTGQGMTTTKLQELPGSSGQYYAHVEQDGALSAPPPGVTVTNYSNAP